MKKQLFFAILCTLAMMAASVTAAIAQDEPKEKPPLYSYVASWNIPRGGWGDMEKADAADQKLVEKGLSDGSVVAFGSDQTLVHTADGMTHDSWWSTTSLASLLNTLEKFYKSGNTTAPVLASATKHTDGIFVARYYNWKPGTYKNAYTRVGMYKLKGDAPQNALETISKSYIVPALEKLLAEGSIVEYEIDTEVIHTDAPGTFWIDVILPNAEGLDKLTGALTNLSKSNPMNSAAFESIVDSTVHRDNLSSTTATYK
jgi:hypothetical protein